MLHLTGGPLPRRVKRRLVLAIALGIVAVLLLVPELFGLAGTLPLAMLVAFRPTGAVGLLVFALLAVVVRRRWWPAALTVALVAAVALGFVVVSRAIPGTAPAPARSLTLLSFNVYDGRADVVTLARTIDIARPDVVVLPEAGERYRQLLMPKVAYLGYRSWTTGKNKGKDVNGIVVLAGPWLGSVTAEPLRPGSRFQWMQLTGGALGAVRVVAVHAAAPVPGLTQDWFSDIAVLRQRCGFGGGTNILIGDFNATLDHSRLRSAIRGCTDAAADRGRGLVATWPSYLPRWFGVQIDHVFVSANLRPASLEVLDIPGSDHRALLTRVIVPSGTARP